MDAWIAAVAGIITAVIGVMSTRRVSQHRSLTLFELAEKLPRESPLRAAVEHSARRHAAISTAKDLVRPSLEERVTGWGILGLGITLIFLSSFVDDSTIALIGYLLGLFLYAVGLWSIMFRSDVARRRRRMVRHLLAEDPSPAVDLQRYPDGVITLPESDRFREEERFEKDKQKEAAREERREAAHAKRAAKARSKDRHRRVPPDPAEESTPTADANEDASSSRG